MRNLKPVKDRVGLFRDESTNAIINNNFDEYQNYLKKRESMLKKDKKIDDVSLEITKLKDDIDEIKSLLKMIVNSSNT
jgi:hypothetical protein